MALSKRTTAQARKLVRQQLVYEARVDREIEKSCAAYRDKMEKIFAKTSRSGRPRTIIAEGDSWFRYILRPAIPSFLDRRPMTEVLNLAAPGDEVRDMLTLRQRERLIGELRRGPARRQRFDAFVFSGGGNDLLGSDRFRTWLVDYEPGMQPGDLIDRRSLKAILHLVECGYREVISIRDAHSPTTKLYIHGYDFAQPNGRGVCGRGPWLKPSLVARRVPARMRSDVVKLFLQVFERRLRRIVRNSSGVTLVPTQGTLSVREWANEIHPTGPGFRKIAGKFAELIEFDLPR